MTRVAGLRKQRSDNFTRVELLWGAMGIFVPLVLVAAVVLYLLFHVQATAVQSVTRSNEERTVEIGRQRATAELASVVSDVRYLARQQALRRWLASGDSSGLQALRDEYLAFAAEKAIYDQVRFLDLAAREVVRVNWNAGSPAVVAEDQLQDKVERYYVRDTLDLDAGEVYVSPFDLNVEQGVLEQPLKPVIRFGAPAFDADGRKRGMVILNYLGRRLLDAIEALGAGTLGRIWLINEDGYWLLGPTAQDEWAFMYPERRERAFARTHAEAWARIGAAEPAGQLVAGGDLFTYSRIASGAGWRAPSARQDAGARTAASENWYLVTHVPSAVLAGQRSALARGFLLASAAIACLLAALAAVVARHGARRRRVDGRLRASEARFRAVADSASDAIIAANAAGRITYFNTAAERIFAYTAEEVAQQPLTLLMPERFHHAHREGVGRFLAGGERRVIGKTVELVGRRKDGEEFPVELSLADATVDREVFFTGILRDITRRKLDEQRLRDSESRFRALLESAPDAVVITDAEGRIVLINAQTERLFGYPRDRLTGQPVEMLVPERFRARHVGHRNGYVAAPCARPMGMGLELYGLRADGTEFPVAISLSPVETDEGVLIVSDVRDVSERRKIERKLEELNERLTRDNAELEALNKELEAFSYSVSHDLRAPLRAIDGFSQALLEDCADRLDGDGRSHLARVRQAAQRMGLLIDDLLKLSRVTRIDAVFGDVDLSALTREIVGALQEGAPERPVEVEIANGLIARGDPRLLRVALENLLENAWKFTAGRSPARVEFGQCEQGGETAYYVRDNGVGFDMAYADQLFRAFRRLHDSRAFSGTGIGLATVQRIVHKHGGRIWAAAEPDKGAAFYFTL